MDRRDAAEEFQPDLNHLADRAKAPSIRSLSRASAILREIIIVWI